MKLYNKTKCPDSILLPLLKRAGNLAKARHAGVIVEVGRGRALGCIHAYASRCTAYKIKGRWVNTDGGRVHITLPKGNDSLWVAELFFSIAVHEFAHIADFQSIASGTHLPFSRRETPAGRRPKHAHRPE